MKKKALLLGSVAVMLAASLSVGGMLAYFTDTDAKTNTFTAGNVDIALTETADAVKNEEGKTVVNPGTPKTDGTGFDYHLFPGQAYAKVPVITVDADSEDAYLAATVTFDNAGLKTVSGMPDLLGKAAENMPLLSGGVLDSSTWAADSSTWNGLQGMMLSDAAGSDFVFITEETTANAIVYTYWFVNPVTKDTPGISLFEQFNVPASFDNSADTNTNMTALDDLDISINAYAVQTVGFDNALAAMRAAFPTEFPTPAAP